MGIAMPVRNLLFVCALLWLPISANAAGDWVQTLKRINDSGEINLGYRKDQTPLSFDSGSNRPAGYSVELCNLIASAVKLELGRSDIITRYHPVTAESRFSEIESGKIDILCGATTKTLSRMEIVGFTQSTFVTGAALLSRIDAVVDGVEELAGKRVAVVSNTTTIEALTDAIAELGIDAEVIAVDSTDVGMALLDKKKVDAFSADQVVLIGQVISRGGREKYSLSKDIFSFEPFALALPRGDADFQLIADRVLSELNRTGEILKIYKRWFGSFGKELPGALTALYQLNSTPE
jgi:ABC-type amino acid transport substrate-binding protein